MVLHDRNHHFITRLQPFSRKLSHPVETRRGSSCKEDFSARSCIDKRTNSFSGCFIGCCRPLGQCMHTAVDVGIVSKIIVFDSRQHLLWFLSCRRIVQINQRLIIDNLVQNGKILLDCFCIKSRHEDSYLLTGDKAQLFIFLRE